MKFKLLKIAVVLVMSISVVSCKKYLDINNNPNNATEVDPKLLFSFAVTSLINNRTGGDLFIPMALAGQSMSSGGSSTDGLSWGSSTEDQYVFSPNNFSNIWSQFYTSVGINLKQAITLSEASSPVNNNAAAQCKVILAETFYELTTIYGDIPFSEALIESISAPKFDAQSDVLNGCVTMLDEAITQFDEGSELKISGSYDMFYGGDIDKWKRVARAIKLRVLMTMVAKDPAKSGDITALIASDTQMMRSSKDNFMVSFQDVAGKRNPKFQLGEDYLGGVDFFYASPYVLNPMKAVNDPRIPFFFETAAEWRPKLELHGGATTYNAVLPGDNADDELISKIGIHTATEPELLFSYQEQLFYEAEFYASGLNGSPDMIKAGNYYKEAMLESAIYFGVSTSDAQAFVDDLPALSTYAKPVDQINLQHWIDKMDRGVDAFTQWRRSGPEGSEIPKIELPTGAPAGGLFRRFEYPESGELSTNPNAPQLMHFTEKVWFDQ